MTRSAPVISSDSGRCRQRHDDGLVLGVELPAAMLLGEVQVPVDLTADSDRRAQERAHRGMASREAVGSAMVLDVGQAQWLRLGDQQAKQALAPRPVMDRLDLALRQAHGDELGKPATLVDHAHRAEACVDQRDGRLDDAAQQHLKVQA